MIVIIFGGYHRVSALPHLDQNLPTRALATCDLFFPLAHTSAKFLRYLVLINSEVAKSGRPQALAAI